MRTFVRKALTRDVPSPIIVQSFMRMQPGRRTELNAIKDVVKKVPIPAAGVSLGLVALGGLLGNYSHVAQCVLVALSVAMALLVVAKACLFPSMVRDDMQNPIFASVSATLFMSLMQVAAFFAPVAIVPSFALWAAAVVAHLALMAWFTFRHVRGLKLENVFPTYFICYVGIIVASVTAPAFRIEAVGSVLFWVGFAVYPVLLVLITVRHFRRPTPDPAKPLFCIYSAPASLSIAGYLAVTDEPNLAFVAALLAFAQVMFLVVLTQLPKFVKGGFFPSFAAMTFPFVITATALGKALQAFVDAGFQVHGAFGWLVGAETVFATAMVCFVFAHYMAFLFKPARPETSPRA